MASPRNGHWTLDQIEAHQRRHGFGAPVVSTKPQKPDSTRLAAPPRPLEGKSGVHIAEKAKKAPKMTRTEAEYEAMLKREHPGATILFERYTLKLSNDCRYVPDFAVIEDGKISFHEVKGAYLFGGATKSATQSSLTKPKLAKELFPWHRFFRASKDKEGNWTREEFHAA